MELDSSGLRCGLLVSSCEDSDEPLCSRKCGISWIAEQLLASEVEVCAIELVAVSVYCHWQDDWITEWWKVVEGSTVAWSAYSLDICLEEWNEFEKNVMMVCVCMWVLHMHVATSSYLVYHQKQNQLGEERTNGWHK